MSDDLAHDASIQPAPTILSPPPHKPLRPRRVRVAHHVSNILSPVAVSLPFVFLVALYHAQNVLMALLYALIVLFFLSFGPMIYVLVGVQMGKFTDADVSVRSQRTGPFLFGIASALAGLGTLFFAHGPKNLQTLLLITVVSGVVMMIVTLWWKISIHASSLAAAVTLLTALYGSVILPLFVLLAAVCWSRIVLRRHTLGQVIAGSLVSIALTTLVLAIRGI
ncbi:MAG: phosphatase PAP2 family protein [Ktedonobacteraceae bacterium]